MRCCLEKKHWVGKKAKRVKHYLLTSGHWNVRFLHCAASVIAGNVDADAQRVAFVDALAIFHE